MNVTITHTIYSAHLANEEFNETESGDNFAAMVESAYQEWLEKHLSDYNVCIEVEVMSGVSGVGSGLDVSAEDANGCPDNQEAQSIKLSLDQVSGEIFNAGEWFVA